MLTTLMALPIQLAHDEARSVRYGHLSAACAETCNEVCGNWEAVSDPIAVSRVWHHMALACISLKYKSH